MRAPRFGLLLVLGILTVVGAVVPASAAHAADPLELSIDGSTWSSTLPGALFGSPAAAVPGDVIVSALWVRNGSGDPARVTLDVADDLGDAGTLAGDLALSIDGSPAPGGTRWQGPVLAPGASVRIPLVVTFDASSQLSSRLSAAAVIDAVGLVQTGVGPGVVPPGPGVAPTSPGSGGADPVKPSGQSAPGGLAHTGADVVRALGVSVGAVIGGLLLLAVRRRARREEA
jgi:hypothetical protein